MKMFSFTASDYREQFAEHGWVHVQAGLTEEFLGFAQASIAAARADARRLEGTGIAGEKQQLVFDFPDASSYAVLFDTIATTCALNPGLTLSERHVKIYEEDADPDPAAHKDRFASQISMGLSLDVPPGSHLVLYPNTENWVNPFLNTALRDSLEPDQLPEVVLVGAPEVRIDDQPGDVIIFQGSAFWHLRRNSANTVNIYVKFNEFGSDPLGEDPSTPARRRATLDLIEAGKEEELSARVALLSRRFDSISLESRREGWPDRRYANVWGQNPFPISAEEDRLLRVVDAGSTVSQLLEAGHDIHALRRLAKRGALDLVSVGER